jgi:hypothetical protein
VLGARYTDPGKPAIAWDDLAAGDALLDALVTDTRRLLTRLEVAADDPKAAETLALLALVAGQDVEWVAGDDTDEDHTGGRGRAGNVGHHDDRLSMR